MGVDTRITLPNDVRVRDVAAVMGILAGLEARQTNISRGYKSTRVDGVEVSSCKAVAECASIELHGEMIDGDTHHHALYHFEGHKGKGRMLCPRSTPFWVAIGVGLIKFFGGTIDFADCDDVDVDREYDKPRECNSPEDGKEWQAFENEMFELKPVELFDEDKCAYSMKEIV